MSIFDALSGSAYKTAAKNNAAAIQQGAANAGNSLNTNYGLGQSYLGASDGGNALNSLRTGLDSAKGDLTGGYGNKAGGFANLFGSGSGSGSGVGTTNDPGIWM